MLNAALKDCKVKPPATGDWAEKKLAEGVAVFDLPGAHRAEIYIKEVALPRPPHPAAIRNDKICLSGQPEAPLLKMKAGWCVMWLKI